MHPAVEALSLNHWTIRESMGIIFMSVKLEASVGHVLTRRS